MRESDPESATGGENEGGKVATVEGLFFDVVSDVFVWRVVVEGPL